MRKIKFRAWGKTSKYGRKEMFYGGFSVSAEGVAYWTGDFREELWDFDKAEILMQHTGLKDKNGKEIYEGDLAKGFYGKHRTRGGSHYDIEEVRWNIDGYWYPFAHQVGYDGVTWQEAMQWFEIIGNIHENPELVEKIISGVKKVG